MLLVKVGKSHSLPEVISSTIFHGGVYSTKACVAFSSKLGQTPTEQGAFGLLEAVVNIVDLNKRNGTYSDDPERRPSHSGA